MLFFKRKKNKDTVAFFCMEYALDNDSTTYAGGLGILAGDYILECADKNLSVIAFGLHYGSNLDGLILITTLDITIAGESIKVKVWKRKIKDSVTMVFFDTNIPENTEENKTITNKLYDSNFYNRIKQQMILGIGGIRILKELDIKPKVYHLNEGHTSFASLALLAEGGKYKAPIVATKHTIFSDAGIFITKTDFDKYIAPYCIVSGLSADEIFKIGEYDLDNNKFSTTGFLINTSDIKNGVSVLHTVYEKKVHENSTLIPITNGVYPKRWRSDKFAGELSDEELLKVKSSLRSDLVSFVKEKTGEILNPDTCTVVWARRFAAYKRPFLLFSDIERLKKIVSNTEKPIQFVISGKSHAADAMGQDMINKIIELSKTPEFKGKIVYIPNYSLLISRYLVQGADVWLNTPERGKEACGTSGIKASMNGALQCSVSDGWVDEVDWSNIGFVLSEDKTVDDLYEYLEKDIPDTFYNKPDLAKRMRTHMDIVNSNYTTERMLNDYMKKVYGF